MDDNGDEVTLTVPTLVDAFVDKVNREPHELLPCDEVPASLREASSVPEQMPCDGDQGQPVEWIFIDGAKQPWLLPEWTVWENVFSGVYTIRRKRLEGSPLDSLAVTPSELKRFENAAFWYSEHRDACAERQKKEVGRLRAARRPAADVVNRQREVILECRQQVLDRADALLRDMSHNGRVALLAYVEARKRGMWSRTAKSELEFYRLPR